MSSQRLLGHVLLVLLRLSAPPGGPPRTSRPGRYPATPRARLRVAEPSRAPTVAVLAGAVGLPDSRLRQALAALERAGLVDASGPRLTMPGLVVAAALRTASGAAPSLARARRPQPLGAARTTPTPPAPSVGASAARAARAGGGLGDGIPSAA